MSSVNSSNLIKVILKYLKVNKEVKDDLVYNDLINNIETCINEVEKNSDFKYIYKYYTDKKDFLNNEPYMSFLGGCEGYYLVACTLGLWFEKQINYLSKVDVSKMIIMDAVGSAYLELKANEYESSLLGDKTYRFCPGYSNSDINDIKLIYKLINADKIGIEVLDSCMMIPQKSMIGIIGVKKYKVVKA